MLSGDISLVFKVTRTRIISANGWGNRPWDTAVKFVEINAQAHARIENFVQVHYQRQHQGRHHRSTSSRRSSRSQGWNPYPALRTASVNCSSLRVFRQEFSRTRSVTIGDGEADPHWPLLGLSKSRAIFRWICAQSARLSAAACRSCAR